MPPDATQRQLDRGADDTSTVTSRVLMLAFELGEASWLLGFSVGFGEPVIRKKIRSRDTQEAHGTAGS